jgi:hypothetical protein
MKMRRNPNQKRRRVEIQRKNDYLPHSILSILYFLNAKIN